MGTTPLRGGLQVLRRPRRTAPPRAPRPARAPSRPAPLAVPPGQGPQGGAEMLHRTRLGGPTGRRDHGASAAPAPKNGAKSGREEPPCPHTSTGRLGRFQLKNGAAGPSREDVKCCDDLPRGRPRERSGGRRPRRWREHAERRRRSQAGARIAGGARGGVQRARAVVPGSVGTCFRSASETWSLQSTPRRD
jgi:hypothetical protein